MSKYKQKLGHWGENIAVEYLLTEGYSIVERNVRTPYGEIDIIARNLDLIVFVEVKTRSTTGFGMPEESVTQLKQKHIIEAIDYYIQCHPDFTYDWRIDVIAIRRGNKNTAPEITHFQNAITDRTS
jgi:putative endonuclease